MKHTAYFILVFIICLSVISTNAIAKSYWLTGGLIGGAAGAGAGGVISYATCTVVEENTGTCRAKAMPLSIIGGAGIGFAVGALIGSAFKKKHAGSNQQTSRKLDKNLVTPVTTMNPETKTFVLGAMGQF